MANENNWRMDSQDNDTDSGGFTERVFDSLAEMGKATEGPDVSLSGRKGGSRMGDLDMESDQDTDEMDAGTDWEDLAANSGGYEPQQKVTGSDAGAH